MKVINVVGARPNFVKIASIIRAIDKYNSIYPNRIDQILVHTGQHYDENMSRLFFLDLAIPKPDINLEVGSSSHAEQTAEIMTRFEKVCLNENPTHVLVVGDVNSTIACALVATKLGIKVIHVEAGLRSFDRSMPEEINRILTDAISDILFTSEESANANLNREGISPEKIFFVGNVMIDTLFEQREKANKSNILDCIGIKKEVISKYGVLTLHRPANVDDKEVFKEILEALKFIAVNIPIIFPIHPRTLQTINMYDLKDYFTWELFNDIYAHKEAITDGISNDLINAIPPLGYLDFLHLLSNAAIVFTDSGGIQEETTVLGIPCITIRDNTERPITVSNGTNIIAGNRRENIIGSFFSQLNHPKKTQLPPLWDGKAAERIVEILSRYT